LLSNGRIGRKGFTGSGKRAAQRWCAARDSNPEPAD
jgi:hypothetical protein